MYSNICMLYIYYCTLNILHEPMKCEGFWAGWATTDHSLLLCLSEEFHFLFAKQRIWVQMVWFIYAAQHIVFLHLTLYWGLFMLSRFTLTSASSRSGCWLQMFMSRSLQQAEVLIRSSFNPSLKWFFRSHSQDQEEKNFVVAHNLVSRSSERLLRLQQALLSVAPQWQLVGSAQLSQVNLYSFQGNWIVIGVNESSRSTA